MKLFYYMEMPGTRRQGEIKLYAHTRDGMTLLGTKKYMRGSTRGRDAEALDFLAKCDSPLAKVVRPEYAGHYYGYSVRDGKNGPRECIVMETGSCDPKPYVTNSFRIRQLP